MDRTHRTLLAQWLTAFQDAQRQFSCERVEETAIPSYAHKNPAIRWLFRKRLAEIQKILSFPSQPRGIRVLDFGCGSGFGVRSGKLIHLLILSYRPESLAMSKTLIAV